MSASIHAATIEEQGFSPTTSLPQRHPQTAAFIEDHPTQAPFFYRATVEETAATVIIDECGGTWFAYGTIDLEPLGFTQCPVPY